MIREAFFGVTYYELTNFLQHVSFWLRFYSVRPHVLLNFYRQNRLKMDAFQSEGH